MQRVSFYSQISKNKRNSILMAVLVFVVLALLVFVISALLFPAYSVVIVISGIFIVIIYIYSTYRYGDKIVLKTVNAKPADERKHRYLIDSVEGLAIAAGIPKPKVYVYESKEMNAFATGNAPEHASIAVSTALLEKLNRQELEGVIGHEMSHIKNYDIRFATLIAVMVGLVSIISYIFLRSLWYSSHGHRGRGGGHIIFLVIAIALAIIAPIVTRVVQAAVSRQREYLADASSAQLTRYPDGLASALEKLGKYNKGNMKVSEAVSHLFFIDPNKSPLDRVFATHPPLEKRVKILRAM